MVRDDIPNKRDDDNHAREEGDNTAVKSRSPSAPSSASVSPLATSMQSNAKDVLTVQRRFSAAAPVFSDDELLIIPGTKFKQPEEAATKSARDYERSVYLWSSLLAGFGSGALSSIVCAPIDLIRTRLQVMGGINAAGGGAATLGSMGVYSHIASHLRQVVQTEGYRGCFRGLGATMATVPGFWGMYFPLYENFKGIFGKLHQDTMNGGNENNDGRTSPLVHLTSAITAGAFADVACNPMFVVRTRMQTETLHWLEANTKNGVLQGDPSKALNIRQTVASIYGEGGIMAFWRGLTASLIGLSHVAIQFPVYEFLKAEARDRNPDGRERPLDLLMASGLSKVCGSLISYPHEVLRTRMMDARGADAGRNLVEMFRTVVKAEGYGGLYRGLNVSLLRVVPNCCVTFMTYELFMRWSQANLYKIYQAPQ
jgi:solute carrier family 25 folate transporter 32